MSKEYLVQGFLKRQSGPLSGAKEPKAKSWVVKGPWGYNFKLPLNIVDDNEKRE